MTKASPTWIAEFNRILKERYLITVEDAGLEQIDLDRRCDEPADEAVERFANDYDLQRADWPWG
ncbi:MAG: hypothetical protein ACXIUZ_00600 [Lysobacteraceae bacterium]